MALYKTVTDFVNRRGCWTLQQKNALRDAFNRSTLTHNLATGPGTGITTGTGTICKNWIEENSGVVQTSILIDLTGLNSSVAGDIIGKQATANSHIGRITTAESGTLFAGRVTCLETPTTGEPDIDLYSATEATGTEDAAVSGLTETALLDAGIDWTRANFLGCTALPADGQYLYLVGSGGGTDATYDAGKFLIEFWGYRA